MRRLGSLVRREPLGIRLGMLAARLQIASGGTYHPLGDAGQSRMMRPQEAFEERWRLMKPLFAEFQVQNFCDLGCAEGYYVRQAAKLGVMAIGVDSDSNRLRRAAAVSHLDGYAHPCAFLPAKVTKDTVLGLPPFDMIACMSLAHHIIYRDGIDTARSVLSAISQRTRKLMVFDMGGPDEKSNIWAPSLSMFAGDLTKTIPAFLNECGFPEVRLIGQTVGYQDAVYRPLFCAIPGGPDG